MFEISQNNQIFALLTSGKNMNKLKKKQTSKLIETFFISHLRFAAKFTGCKPNTHVYLYISECTHRKTRTSMM